MEKLVKKIKELQTLNCPNGVTLVLLNEESVAEEAKKLAIEFSKYIRLNDYLPQLLENGDIGYVKGNEIWRASSPAEVHSKDSVFDDFLNKYYA